MKTRITYRFDEFWLNPATHELLRGEQEVSLPPKAFGCLTYLIENRDRAVGRDEMISAVWGRVDCTDSVVGRTIFEVRRALGDNGEEPHYIKSVRGVGYRWIAPVDEETVEVPNGNGNGGPFWKHHVFRHWWTPAAIGVAMVLAFGAAWLWRIGGPEPPEHTAFIPAEGEIALLLPVDVESAPNGDHAWIRLGLMDLIAERLRAAGQATVPSDTVIALMRGLPEDFNPHGLDKLTGPTGAGLVLAARAQASGSRWRVSLRTLAGAQPPLTAAAESHDVLEAARVAVDTLVRNLGLSPVNDPQTDAELTRLLQRLRAHILAQELDAARDLLEGADVDLAAHPRIRFKRMALEFERHRLDSAGEIAAALLDDPETGRDPVFHAKVLHALAVIAAADGDVESAVKQWKQASRLLEGQPISDTQSLIYRHLADAMRRRGDLDAARAYVARARRIAEASGDIARLGNLDLDSGLIEAARGNYAEALQYFDVAAARLAMVQEAGTELLARAHIMYTYTFLLDLRSALAVQPRVDELVATVARLQYVAWAHLAKLHAFRASGQHREFQDVKKELTALSEAHPSLRAFRHQIAMLDAEDALAEGDFSDAMEKTRNIFARWSPGDPAGTDGSWAGVLLNRAYLGLGDMGEAEAVVGRLVDSTAGFDHPSRRVNASLAGAELAAAAGDHETAATMYEQALSRAGNTPLLVLRVVQSQVSWLLSPDSGSASDLEHALALTERLTFHADRHYEAALLQLRVYHATGPVSAWRAALNRTQLLAGEREIPPELLTPPAEARYGAM